MALGKHTRLLCPKHLEPVDLDDVCMGCVTEEPTHFSFETLRHVSQERCIETFGPLEDRPVEWWTNAMAGESGEACNVAKKMSRIRLGKGDTWNKEEDRTIEALRKKLKREIGDVVIYADLLASREGLTLEDCVRTAFNEKSAEIGSDKVLP